MLQHLAFIEYFFFTDCFYDFSDPKQLKNKSKSSDLLLPQLWWLYVATLSTALTNYRYREGKCTFCIKRYACSSTVTNFLGDGVFWFVFFFKAVSCQEVGLIIRNHFLINIEPADRNCCRGSNIWGRIDGKMIPLTAKCIEIIIWKLSDEYLRLVLGTWWIWEGSLASFLLAIRRCGHSKG